MPVREGVQTIATAEVLRTTVTTFRDLLRAHQQTLNRLNVYPVPDGDTGTNMWRTLDSVVAELDAAPAELAATCDAISHGALMGARGNSGVIVSQILRGLAGTFKRGAGDSTALVTGHAGGALAAAALQAAADAAYQAVLTPIEGTILTVVRESAEGAVAAAERGDSLDGVLAAARDAGRIALANTPELLPVLKDAGVVDAGGAGYLLLLDAALHVVAGEPLPAAQDGAGGGEAEPVAAMAEHAAAHGTRYEVMFLCHLDDARIGQLKEQWGEVGDSIVVVGGEGLWNCHVHTNDIGAAIEVPLGLDGRPFQIRVTDLFDEVAAEHALREEAMTEPADGDDGEDGELPAVTCAAVAVSSGPGIGALFRQLGVQVIVEGGQTQNPSTAELLDAVERANAGHVVLLPGNKNIIPVAEQVDSLTAKTVRVVPTRSMPEGLAALMAYDPEADAPANVLPMRRAADAVATGEVTQAVRASVTPAGRVAAGDWMGIASGPALGGRGIVAIAATALDAAKELLEHLVGDDAELVTAIAGADATEGVTAELQEWFATRFADIELEVHDGGQPLYPFLFGVE